MYAIVSGVEFRNECFCGDFYQKSSEVSDSLCKQYLCPGNNTVFCGGYETIAIYSTGILGLFSFLKKWLLVTTQP